MLRSAAVVLVLAVLRALMMRVPGVTVPACVIGLAAVLAASAAAAWFVARQVRRYPSFVQAAPA
ncbi:MAG TPA: hypothetical protein VNF47_23190 [Streptosporangiaceae bacterium]|nr:hypothetical protein [Streptosporangiaceae bacterium]